MKLQSLGRYRLNGDVLGKGNFARVEMATHSVLSTKVAIKIIDVDKVKEDYVRRNLGREVKVMSRLKHPNIVRLYETMMSGHLYCLMMEFAPGGDLCSFVKAQKEGRFTEARARPFCRQLVSALTYMHGRGIIHRDLKMENIMLNTNRDSIKIVDFGLSNCWSPESPLKSHCGSPEYAAPELFVVGRTYGPEIDVWSMGVVFYVLLVGRLPFLSSKQEGLSRQERRDRLIAHINQGLGGNHRSDMKHLGSESRRLLTKVLEPLPARRLTMRHVAMHPWITHKGLSPLPAYQHPRVGAREHNAAIQHMADVLSIKPQLIDERVMKQMYDDIAGMYNILTHVKETGHTNPPPTEARIRPLELRTPSKRPLTSGSDPNSPLRSDKSVRPAVAHSPKSSIVTSNHRGVHSASATVNSIPRSGINIRDRPKAVSRRPAHITRPTTAPPSKTSGRDETNASHTASMVVDVNASRPPRMSSATPPVPSASNIVRRRHTPVTGLLRSVNERLRRETDAGDSHSILNSTPRGLHSTSNSSQMPPITPASLPSNTSRQHHKNYMHQATQPSPPESQQQITPNSGRATGSSGSSERTWESPRQRDERKTVWIAEGSWDTPRRHNLTDDQKVRTDDSSQREKSMLLVSGAEDEFSSMYDDATDESSAVDDSVQVVIQHKPPPAPPLHQDEISTTASSGATLEQSRATVPIRAADLRRPNTAALVENIHDSTMSVSGSSRHLSLRRFDTHRPEVSVRRDAPPPPHPLLRKSPSDYQSRDQIRHSPRGPHYAPPPQQHRRSGLPLAQNRLRSPAKTTSSAHAWFSAHRSSGSWSSHDRLDLNGSREGRYHANQSPAAVPELKPKLKESETQTPNTAWREEPGEPAQPKAVQADRYSRTSSENDGFHEPRESRPPTLRQMLSQEQPGTPYPMPAHQKKKLSTPERLQQGNIGKRSAYDDRYGQVMVRPGLPRDRYRPQTAGAPAAGLIKPRPRVLRSSTASAEDRNRLSGPRTRETRV